MGNKDVNVWEKKGFKVKKDEMEERGGYVVNRDALAGKGKRALCRDELFSRWSSGQLNGRDVRLGPVLVSDQ